MDWTNLLKTLTLTRLLPHVYGKITAWEEARLLASPILQEYDAFKIDE